MFNRFEFKNEAKMTLAQNWKLPALITLLVLLVDFIFGIPSLYAVINSDLTTNVVEPFTSIDFVNSMLELLVDGIFAIALSCFYLTFTKDSKTTNFRTFLNGLNFWQKGITVALWKALFTFLWSLLFIIPGIIKYIAYSQMEFIIAENPRISTKNAMKMSITMTQGFKLDFFILELSFIGWVILAIITFGIGYVWVEPYMYCANANAYKFLKSQSLENGTLSYADFGMQQKLPESISQNTTNSENQE